MKIPIQALSILKKSKTIVKNTTKSMIPSKPSNGPATSNSKLPNSSLNFKYVNFETAIMRNPNAIPLTN